MRLPEAKELAQLPVEKLADLLIDLAREVRQRVRQGETEVALAYLDQLKAATDCAQGASLAMLETTTELLRTVTRTHWGKRERAVRRVLALDRAGGTRIIERLLDGDTVASLELTSELKSAVGELHEAGVLKHDSNRYQLVPAQRQVVREVMEPLPLRMWREVQSARHTLHLSPVSNEEGAAFLAGRLGLSEDEGRDHLKRFPVLLRRDLVRAKAGRWTNLSEEKRDVEPIPSRVTETQPRPDAGDPTAVGPAVPDQPSSSSVTQFTPRQPN